MRNRFDVAVCGAGPAGSAAAITLARMGRSVVLIDKAVFPRDKCCGDGLTTAALRRLENLGLDPSRVPSWAPVDEVVVVAADGRSLELPLHAGEGAQFAASARRAELDAALVDLAVEAGATFMGGTGVTGLGTLVDGVSVQVGEQSIECRYLIAADGMWSPVRRLLGLGTPGYLGDWQAGRQYYAGAGPQAKKLWVWFEKDMIPGYAWSFPLAGGMVNVGYGVLRSEGSSAGPSELRGQRVELLDRDHIAEVLGPRARPVGPWRAWPIPAGIGQVPVSGLGGRVLFVGDAARACDPMTGEGIAQAMETAEMAALALASAGPDQPVVAARRYWRRIRYGMALDDRLARAFSRVLARPGGSVKAVAIADSSALVRQHFARWMFEAYPRAVLATPHRWRRDMFGRPASFPVDATQRRLKPGRGLRTKR